MGATSDHRPDFGRLRKALLLEGEPDRVPLAEVNIHPAIKGAVLGKPISDLPAEVEFWVSAGYDYVPVHVGLAMHLARAYEQTESDTFTGVRSVQLLAEWAEEKAGAITSEAEFEAFPWPTSEDMGLSVVDEVQSYLPGGARVIGTLITAVFTQVWKLMGFETFCLALGDQPALVEKMFDKVGTIQYGVFDSMLRSGNVGAIWVTDDVAYTEGLMVSPNVLRRYLFPWFERMGQAAREAGLPLIYHSDGLIDPVLDDIVACGFNAIHPIEPKAMDIDAVKRKVGHKLCLIGNIDLSHTLTRGTPQEVEEEVKLRLKTIAPGGGYCLGSGNSIPDYVPVENFNAMREAALRYGWYPIQL